MFKTCPACGGEFQAWVARCPDCGGALALASGAAPVARPPPPELPPARELVCVERGEPWSLRELAERFQADGLSCRIDVHPPEAAIRAPSRRGGAGGTQFGLYVREGDVARAQQLRSAHLREIVPDAAHLPDAAGQTLADCPACGTRLAEGAATCAECGLEFPELGAEG